MTLVELNKVDIRNKVRGIVSAKEIWDTLKMSHEGSEEVKEEKMDLLQGELEAFVMKKDVTVQQMHDRLTVRPGTAGLLIGIEYSRVRDSSWMYLTSFCNYPNRRRTSYSTRKLIDCIVEGLQLYSARTFHVTIPPDI